MDYIYLRFDGMQETVNKAARSYKYNIKSKYNFHRIKKNPIFAVGIKKMEDENNKFKNTGNVGT